MQNVIVPLNAFDRSEVLKNGQASYVGLIAQTGAYGIEIRRELFVEQDYQFNRIRQEKDHHELFTVYSAPIELWKEDYQLNEEELKTVFQEGVMLGSKWLKLSLGHFDKEKSNLNHLKVFLEEHQEIQLLVENDQTLHGGNVCHLRSFFETAYNKDIPVKMTFDAGNWYYSNQIVENAIETLAPYVIYLHLKQVETRNGELVTIPLQKDGNPSWKRVMKHFPADIVKALEFPIEPEGIKAFIDLVTEEAITCSNS